MTRIFFLIAALIIHFKTSAQETGFLEGLIVKNNGDTIRGLVKNKNLAPYRILKNVKFKPVNEGKTEVYSPNDLKGYETGANRYVSKLCRDYTGTWTKSFVEILVDGYLSLFELQETLMGVGNEIGYRMLQRKNDTTLFSVNEFSVYEKKYKERLLLYLKDEPALCNEIAGGKYPKSDIHDLVRDYNLLKFKPEPCNNCKKAAVFFCKVFKTSLTDLYLTINDSVQYHIPEKLFIESIELPLYSNIKVCYGSSTEKTCELIFTLPSTSERPYYQLTFQKKVFKIEKKDIRQYQKDIIQARTATN